MISSPSSASKTSAASTTSLVVLTMPTNGADVNGDAPTVKHAPAGADRIAGVCRRIFPLLSGYSAA